MPIASTAILTYLGMYSRIDNERLNALAEGLGLNHIESVTLHGGGGYLGFSVFRLGLYSLGSSAESNRELVLNGLPF